jgi:DNA-binding LacI/PurR family transcriptional regulator
MVERITMKTLAEASSLSVSTVSRALRDDRRISQAVRRQVQDLAEALDYRPNPMVSALMASRRKSGGGEVDTVALITDYRGRGSWQTKDVCQWEYDGICERAAELGFRIEEFALADYGHDPHRLERTLATRGIRGVLLGFTRDRPEKSTLDLKGFSVAGLSTYFKEIPVDRANFHGLYNVRLALEQMRELGFKRTGLVAPEFNNRVSGYLWSGGALDWQRSLPEDERCDPFLPANENSEREFLDWLDQQKPDSIIVYKLPVRSWLSKRGIRVPQDIGLAHLFRTRKEMSQGMGIDGNLQRVGAAAFDLVVEGLNTNRSGIPENPKEVLIRGHWLSHS